jgi:hypothetical protein
MCESLCDPYFLTTFGNHSIHALHLCPCWMQPSINLRFEIAHLEINEWFLPITNLLFGNIYSPFVEIDFECMFQRLLDNNICRLQFIGTIGKNKHNIYVWVLFLDPIKKFLTLMYTPTINQPLLVSQVVGFVCAGRPTKPCELNPLLSRTWTNVFH